MLAALGRLLRAAGFDTMLHESAESFLEHAVPTPPVCLIIDVQLGGMSGLDLQTRLLARQSKTPVIFVSAHDGEAQRVRANNLGCLGYFCKPFEGQRLVALIKLRSSEPPASESS